MNRTMIRMVAWALLAMAAPAEPLTALAVAPHGGFAFRTATLKDRLEKDLRAGRPAEFAFVARVIELVDSDVLPLDLVESTYLWARKKEKNRFEHFAQALRLRAARRGIEI